MKKLLNICKTFAGIREDITDAEEMVIVDLIQTEFNFLSPEEIGRAFKMNASGKYWEIIEAYQTFSPIYVGKILTAYKEWKRKENAKPKLLEPLKQLPEAKIDPKKSFDFIKNVWINEGKMPIIANWKIAFDYAENKGLIKLTDKQKLKKYQEKEQQIRLKIQTDRFKEGNFRKINIAIDSINIKTECRKDAIFEYLKNLEIENLKKEL